MMDPVGMFDLHCDTLTNDQYVQLAPGVDTLDDPDCQLSLRAMPAGTPWGQCFAIFVPDRCRGQEAADFFDRYAASFHRQMEAHRDRAVFCRRTEDMDRAIAEEKCAALLTVEGGAALAGRLERVETLREAGVQMLTLTWNGPNELASGHDGPGGLTDFGREAVAELERAGIVLDVSHLNDRGFEDLVGVAKTPLVASHSNARAVCGHRRNLPDEFILEIVRRGGLIGLNYSTDFLSDRPGGGSLEDLARHVDHFLELGAAKCLALGSDYDGTDMHEDLNRVEKSLGIRSFLVRRGVPEDTAADIVFNNAYRFFARHMA